MVKQGFIAVVLAVTLNGCLLGGIANMATFKGFHLTEDLCIKNPKRDPIKVAEEVGTEMGFKVQGRMPGILMLTGGSNFITETITGHHKTWRISFTDYNKSDRVHRYRAQAEGVESFKDRYSVMVMVAGGLGAGTESEAKRIMDEFKQKLLQKLDAPKGKQVH